jgi:hypothetical protein
MAGQFGNILLLTQCPFLACHGCALDCLCVPNALSAIISVHAVERIMGDGIKDARTHVRTYEKEPESEKSIRH